MEGNPLNTDDRDTENRDTENRGNDVRNSDVSDSDDAEHVLDSVCAANPIPDIAEVVTDYHADVYRYAYRLAKSQADAEDLTQQTFLVAQQKLSQVRDASKVRGWLLVVVRSLSLKSRRKKVPVPAGGLELNLEQIPAQGENGYEIDTELLQRVLATLSDEYRLVLGLFYFEELSYKEIASELDVPLGTVMSRLSRAKGQLRRGLLEAEGGQEFCRPEDTDTTPVKKPFKVL